MRKTGNRLLAVLAAVSMTVSLLPANAVTAAQTDKAQSVQKVTTAQTGGKAQSVQAADSLKKASKAPVTFSEASGTYKDAFSLKLQGADTDTAIYYTTDGSDPSDPDNTARIAYADSGISITDRKNDENVLSAIDPILFDAVNVKGSSDQKSFVSTISAPDKSKVDKCTVIKAAAQHEDGTYSDVVTNTYFVGDMAEHIDGISESCKAAGKDLAVMSISMDADDLFDSAKGIYVKGDTFDKALKEYLDGGGKVDWDASDLCGSWMLIISRRVRAGSAAPISIILRATELIQSASFSRIVVSVFRVTIPVLITRRVFVSMQDRIMVQRTSSMLSGTMRRMMKEM